MKPWLLSSALWSSLSSNPWSPAGCWSLEATFSLHLSDAQSKACIGVSLMVYRALAHFLKTLVTDEVSLTHTPQLRVYY